MVWHGDMLKIAACSNVGTIVLNISSHVILETLLKSKSGEESMNMRKVV